VWFTSEIHEILLGGGSLIFTIVRFEGWSLKINREILSPESAFTLIVAIIFLIAYLVSTNIVHKTKSFYSTETGGHVKAFFDTTLRIVNRNVASLDDPVIKEVGYLKVGNLIRNYKRFEQGEIPILNLDHFLEIWKVITEKAARPEEVLVIEFLPNDINWAEYDDTEVFYTGLQKLSRMGTKVHRTIYTQSKDSWDEDFASHLFSQMVDNDIYSTDVGVYAGHHNRIYILVIYPKKCYMIYYQEPLAVIGDGINSDQNATNDRLLISKDLEKSKNEFQALYGKSITPFNVSRRNIFGKILESDRLGDAKEYYRLYSEVCQHWEKNVKNGWSDIYGVDTSMLSNDIQDWLNKAFYRRILEDNGKFTEVLSEKGKVIKRIFVLSEKMREAKIPIVKKIVTAHLKNKIIIGLLDIKWLIYLIKQNSINKEIFHDLRDFNLMPMYCNNKDNTHRGVAFEICGLRRRYESRTGFETFWIGANVKFPPSHPWWTHFCAPCEDYKKLYDQWNALSGIAVWFSTYPESEQITCPDDITNCYSSRCESERSTNFQRSLTDNKIKLEKLLQIIAIKEPDYLDQKSTFNKG
jgi:hypothetical protein